MVLEVGLINPNQSVKTQMKTDAEYHVLTFGLIMCFSDTPDSACILLRDKRNFYERICFNNLLVLNEPNKLLSRG